MPREIRAWLGCSRSSSRRSSAMGICSPEPEPESQRESQQERPRPYMLEEQHIPDTVFFSLEEDFRLFDDGEPIAPKVKGSAAQEFLGCTTTVRVKQGLGSIRSGRGAGHIAERVSWEKGCSRRPQETC